MVLCMQVKLYAGIFSSILVYYRFSEEECRNSVQKYLSMYDYVCI